MPPCVSRIRDGWRSCRARPGAVRIRRCLLWSLLFMLAGHVAVMLSGAVFDPRTGDGYHPARRWVSDFAAKWPEGLLIKVSIAFFCIALFDFFRGLVRQHGRPGGSALKVWWILTAAAMIGGLTLVVVFDMSPAQYEYHRANLLFRLFGRDGRFVELPRSYAEWVMRAQHQLGFRLFVAGYFAAALTLLVLEWRQARSRRLPVTMGLVAAACGLAAWLLVFRTALPGLPQRGLLVLMFIWLLREIRDGAASRGEADP